MASSYAWKITWLIFLISSFMLSRSESIKNFSELTFTISIISNNRLASLQRLVSSLLNVHNPNNINLRVIFNLESTSSPNLIDYVYDIKWPHGEKIIKKRIVKGGLIVAITESWYPSSEKDYGVLLEDDIEVSPLFLVWIEMNLKSILENKYPFVQDRVIGISLYSPRVIETTTIRRRLKSYELSSDITGTSNSPYLYQTPCSWGAVYFPKPWREFISYLHHRQDTIDVQPPVTIPGSRTNDWAGSWKKFLFELMYVKGYFLLYPNFSSQRSFSTNHLEIGEHINKRQKRTHPKSLFTVPLFQKNDLDTLQSMKLLPLHEMPWIDQFGSPFLNSTTLYHALHDLKTYQSQSASTDVAPPLSSTSSVKSSYLFFPNSREDIYQKDEIADRVIDKSQASHWSGASLGSGSGSMTVDTRSILMVGKKLTWRSKSYILVGGNAIDGSAKFVYVAFINPKGQLVIGQHDRKNSNKVSIKDLVVKYQTSESNGSNADDRDYILSLNNAGILKMELVLDGVVAKTIWRSSNRIYANVVSNDYVARLESCGNLIVYLNASMAQQCKGIVWQAIPDLTPSRCHAVSGGASYPSSVVLGRIRKGYCDVFPNMTSNYFRSKETLTISISCMHRFDVLYQQINYYSKSPLVSTIMVTWHNMQYKPPRAARVNNAMVYFVPQQYDSLNNRMRPNILMHTSSVIIMDDDMKVNFDDLWLLFHTYSKFPKNIIGMAPRWLTKRNLTQSEHQKSFTENDIVLNSKNDMTAGLFRYSTSSYDPSPGKPWERPHDGYNFVLTKVLIMDKRYLYDYSCSFHRIPQLASIHAMIDDNNNCEDIALHGIVAYLNPPSSVFSAAPLLVKPMRYIGDYGTSADGVALHLQSSKRNWEEVRSMCANTLNYMYFMRYHASIPSQKQLLLSSEKIIKPNVIQVDILPYSGYSAKSVLECGKKELLSKYGDLYKFPCAWVNIPATKDMLESVDIRNISFLFNYVNETKLSTNKSR